MTEKVAEKKEKVDSTATADASVEGKDAGAKTAGLEGKMAEFVDWIESISVLDLSRLVKALEERLGVSAAAPMAMPVVAGTGVGGHGPDASAKEEQTEFSLVLTDVGAQKIQVIKEVRAIAGLGLKESKDLVEGAPKTVKEGLSKEDAAKFKEKLESVGAKVEIK